jgi:hypothetical protein
LKSFISYLGCSLRRTLTANIIFDTMKTIAIILVITAASGLMGCSSFLESQATLEHLKSNEYYQSEIFSQNYLDIYGRWKLFDISGGFTGSGHELDFDILEVKKYGIYGIIRNEDVLEYGKIRTDALPVDSRLRVYFEKDEKAGTYMGDNEKFVSFSGKDTLHLNSPCCDRYNYHFVRIK